MMMPFSQNSSASQAGLDIDTPVEVPKRDEHEDVYVLPASFAQQRLWFLEQWEPGVYNIPFTVGLSGNLNIDAMERAFREIIRRHEALRTTFSMVESQLMQIVSPHQSFALNLIDLQMFSEDVRRTKGRRLIKEEFHRPFDLLHGPLLRVTLLKLKEQSHALLLCMHHIVSDAWSMEILFNEFKTLYAAYVDGQPSPLPDLPIQYADYAIWQRDWLQGDVLNEQLGYWKKQLAGLPALQLPFDHPRPAVQTFRGAVRNMVVPSKLTGQLHLLSRNNGVTLFMTLLGAYQTLLYRYTDQPCIPVGIPIAGRTESNLEPLIGCFINTLVMRTDFDDNPTFLQVLKRVREIAIGAYEHQDIPFEKLVESLQPDRNLSHNPLTQVMFALQNVPQEEVHLPELSFVALSSVENTLKTGVGTHLGREDQMHRAMSENKTAMFDLDMTFWERGEILIAELKYNTDLFEPETIDRLQGYFLTLLENIVADPTQRVNDLSLLSSQERALVVEEWNATATPYPLEHLFHEFVMEQALSTPDSPAVSDGQKQLSYQDLFTRARHLAVQLQAVGIQPEQEQLLGLYMERSVSWAVAVLATMLAGGVYLPLDPHHPAGRLRYILQHAGCQKILTTRGLAARLSDLLGEVPVQVYCIEDLVEQADTGAYRAVKYSGEHLAYVIYTSGSTGMPKGVMVEHKGMLNHLLAKVDALELGPQDIVAQTASQCFDISVWQLLSAWLVGGQVHIYPEWVTVDPEELLYQCEDDRVSVIEVVPSLLRAMLDLLDTASNEPRPALSSLRWMVPTGESLGADLVQRWLHYYPGVPLLNAYGPTECSDDVTHYIINEPLEPEALTRAIPIGRALPNLRLYVLDTRQRPQPVGIWGEIYVGGVGVGRGYLADPARTAQSFVPDPWGECAGGRLYRTGDLGRYLADGALEFLGRVDHQVKLRGYRIEPGEIEQVLCSHPGVRECVVLVREDEPGWQRLVAYVVPQAGESFALEDLRQVAREALPEYMVPSAFVQLEAIPLTPNGKLHRQALPVPAGQDAGSAGEGYVAPRTPLEKQLVDLWSELLGVERVSIYDDFFALGGHSLLTVRLVNAIEKRFGKRLPLASIFQGRTIDALAQLLSRSSEEASPWLQVLETAPQKLDLPSEATLDLTTCPEVWPDEFNMEPASILLSGATGFLGTFLLADLLKYTGADIYCLVRARHIEQARQRLQKSLEEALQWQPEFSARIKPVPGDLASPRLGLSEEMSEHLAQRIDTIYHNGAQVNMLYPYEELKAANVRGTREILSLATRYRVKPVYYISTLSVFPHKGEARIQYVREQDSIDDFHEHVRGGYGQSKWVAEKLVTIARSRGLPVVIYRPGRITGHSESGFWRSDDVLYRMIKGCLQLGMCPIFSTNDTLEMTPVDFVSRAIVSLARRKSSLGQSFHLCCPPGAEARVNDIMNWITTAGFQLQQVPYGEWFKELSRAVAQGQTNELAAILPLLPQPGKPPQDPSQRLITVQDNRYTMKALARTSITCPSVDQNLLQTYLSYMERNNFSRSATIEHAL